MIPSDHDPPVELQPLGLVSIALSVTAGLALADGLAWFAAEIAALFLP